MFKKPHNGKGGPVDSEPADFIHAAGISKTFSHNNVRLEILRGVNFSLQKGETVAIVGASGIGKSTLLHIMGALDRPDKGALWYQGKNVFLFDDDELAVFRNESVGFIFQFHHLLPEFTAIENAMMPALIKGCKPQLAEESAETILVRVGLKDRLHHKIGKLSGGEQQRVALARALVLNPLLLLADEPTGNLDKHNSEQVHELLLKLNQDFNTTLVVVTHNMELAGYMSRSVTLSEGQLVDA
ncbi:MAG: ABC transporter ATP-binding protein [Desulfobacterales bacterium]|nr:ABC transporter ATP-binding protein [Desulfobacterales bacterium]